MGDIVNLRGARKIRARETAERAAAANRLAFGRSKNERKLAEAETMLAKRKLSAHLRDGASDKPDE